LAGLDLQTLANEIRLEDTTLFRVLHLRGLVGTDPVGQDEVNGPEAVLEEQGGVDLSPLVELPRTAALAIIVDAAFVALHKVRISHWQKRRGWIRWVCPVPSGLFAIGPGLGSVWQLKSGGVAVD